MAKSLSSGSFKPFPSCTACAIKFAFFLPRLFSKPKRAIEPTNQQQKTFPSPPLFTSLACPINYPSCLFSLLHFCSLTSPHLRFPYFFSPSSSSQLSLFCYSTHQSFLSIQEGVCVCLVMSIDTISPLPPPFHTGCCRKK